MVSNPISDELLACLGHLGFSQYEARAYCALLTRAPLNGHEVAKASGVPPSKIYETLNRLADKGAVLVQHSSPVSYAPTPYETVLGQTRRRFDEALSHAEAGLARLPAPSDPGAIWSLTDREAVLAACVHEIRTAQYSVFAALWDGELEPLREALEACSRRGCAVHVAVYGEASLHGPKTYDLTLCGASAVERLGGRRLSAIVADQARTIVAEFSPHAVEAVVTSNRVVSLLAVEYIKADVLGRLLINDMGDDRFEHLRRTPGLIDSLLRA